MRTLLVGLALLTVGCATGAPGSRAARDVDLRIIVQPFADRTVAHIIAAIDVPQTRRPVTLSVSRDGVAGGVLQCADQVCTGSVEWPARAAVGQVTVTVEDAMGNTTSTTVEVHSRPTAPLRRVPNRK